MGGPPGSQAAPLPSNLPFRLVSKTIGCGAYASIRKAAPKTASTPIIAVKFIHKEHAFRTGRLRPKQLLIEISLHQMVSGHDNVIRYLSHSTDDPQWVWMAMELAEGGDLFDKIEADVGVGENVAHFYFTQLVAAISWCHGKGVAHRDVKPENVLVSGSGDLKVADFGLATRFRDDEGGKRKWCAMVCGSPPYIAPEILAVGRENAGVVRKRKAGTEGGGEGDVGEGGKAKAKAGYDPEAADVWSVAIVLFVLLAGNTPWDSPVMGESYEFHDFVSSGGKPGDELWEKIPPEAMGLVLGMLSVDVGGRMGMQDVKRHPWFTRRNPHLNAKGKAANPVGLATQLLEGLRIDFSSTELPTSSQQQPPSQNAMDIDTPQPSQQPPPPPPNLDWEPSQSQAPTSAGFQSTQQARDFLLSLASDPAMSQFMATPSVPLTLTQQARQFKDILPSASLAKFFSPLPLPQLLVQLQDAFARLDINLAIPTTPAGNEAAESQLHIHDQGTFSLYLSALDTRQQPLQGHLVFSRFIDASEELIEVRFLKAKGDPVGWRRLFKRVAVLCREGIVRPPE